jgi:hypothetical protein
MLPSGRWALTPPFHPYQALSPSAIRLRGLLSGCLKVFLQMATEAHCTGGLFSVALSVAGNLASLARTARRAGPLALPGALPFSLRRFPLKTFVPAKNAKTTVSGLSSRPAFLRRLAQRSPGLPAILSISSCVGRKLGRWHGKIHTTETVAGRTVEILLRVRDSPQPSVRENSALVDVAPTFRRASA